MKKALFIGINYIGTDSELNGCMNDVANIKSFAKRAGYNNYRTLIETTNNHKPTRANILKYMAWLVQDAKPGDRLFLHYSGHGSWEKDTSGDEDDGRDELLVPLDYETAGFISDDELRQVLVDKVPTDVFLFCLFDCCHSGTVLDLRYKYMSDTTYHGPLQDTINYVFKDWSQNISYSEQKNYPKTQGQIVMISGCRDKQTSADAFIKDDKTYQGALTWAFLQIMKDNGVYQKSKSKKDQQTGGAPVDQGLKYKHLIKDLRCLLKVKKYTQVPQLTSGNYIDLNSNFTL